MLTILPRLITGLLRAIAAVLPEGIHNKLFWNEFPFDNDQFAPFGTVRDWGRQSFFVGAYGRRARLDLLPIGRLRALSAAAVELIPLSRSSTLWIEADSLVPIGRRLAGRSAVDNTLWIDRQEFSVESRPATTTWIGVAGKSQLTVSTSDIALGTPISRQHLASVEDKPDVLLLFVDGLSEAFFRNVSLEAVMPHTAQHFPNAARSTALTSGEWTLPSFASIWTGMSTLNHGLWHPDRADVLPKDAGLLPETFKASGYVTSWINTNWRTSPSYGYFRGIDRMLYWREASASWVAREGLDFLEALPDRKHFMVFSFMDIHQPWEHYQPPIQIQASSDVEYLLSGAQLAGKTVSNKRSTSAGAAYLRALRRLDANLQVIYKEAERRGAVTVLCSDHGQSYLTESLWPLSRERSVVPLFVRMPDCAPTPLSGIEPKLLMVRDIFHLLEGIAKGSPPSFPRREFAVSESIYPGQTYKARLSAGVGIVDVESMEIIGDAGPVSELILRVVEHGEVQPNQLAVDRALEFAQSRLRSD